MGLARDWERPEERRGAAAAAAMDASAGAGPGRGGAATPVQNARKEWRVVSEHHSPHAASDRQGREPADVDFCSITIDGGVQNDILQQRLNHVSRQREELQQMEVELRARAVVRLEVMEMRDRFEAQIKEHASNASWFRSKSVVGIKQYKSWKEIWKIRIGRSMRSNWTMKRPGPRRACYERKIRN